MIGLFEGALILFAAYPACAYPGAGMLAGGFLRHRPGAPGMIPFGDTLRLAGAANGTGADSGTRFGAGGLLRYAPFAPGMIRSGDAFRLGLSADGAGPFSRSCGNTGSITCHPPASPFMSGRAGGMRGRCSAIGAVVDTDARAGTAVALIFELKNPFVFSVAGRGYGVSPAIIVPARADRRRGHGDGDFAQCQQESQHAGQEPMNPSCVELHFHFLLSGLSVNEKEFVCNCFFISFIHRTPHFCKMHFFHVRVPGRKKRELLFATLPEIVCI